MSDGIEEILVCDGLQVAFAVMLYHLQDQQFAAVLEELFGFIEYRNQSCLLYTSPSPRD